MPTTIEYVGHTDETTVEPETDVYKAEMHNGSKVVFCNLSCHPGYTIYGAEVAQYGDLERLLTHIVENHDANVPGLFTFLNANERDFDNLPDYLDELEVNHGDEKMTVFQADFMTS